VIIPAIIERIKSKHFSAVILDPLYKLLGDLDENCAGDMNKLMNELEQVTIEAGASIILATHYSKANQAGKNPRDRISGSGVLTGNLLGHLAYPMLLRAPVRGLHALRMNAKRQNNGH
jgi:RecA-family ATPase